MLPALDAAVSRRVALWVTGLPIDAYACARELAFAVVGSAVAGFADDADLHALGLHFADVLDGPHPKESVAERTQRLAPVRETIEYKLDAAIAESLRTVTAESPGLLAALLRAKSCWTDSDLRQHFNLLLVTGHETTGSLVAWILVLLAEYPAWQERIAAELAAVPAERHPSAQGLEALPAANAFVSETARLHPPLLNAPRRVVRDFKHANVHVPAGARVALALSATNLVAQRGDDAGVFRPERFLPGHAAAHGTDILTFGAGARLCLGARFARIEVLVLLFRLLRDWRIERDGEGPIVNAGFWNARPRGDLSLRLTPRRSGDVNDTAQTHFSKRDSETGPAWLDGSVSSGNGSISRGK